MVPYIGNGPYCYANATAMLLASIGENVPPSQIEVLTGQGQSVAEAARMLNVGRTTLVEKIRKYDLDTDASKVA